MNKHLFNTIKIVSAAITSILISTILNLEFSISSGIITILTIQPTKKETINTALSRLIAFLCALLISFLTYNIFGYNVIGFAFYLLIYIYICHMYNWNHAMAPISVLISHFLTFKEMNIYTLNNELLIFTIGVSLGILANMHLHKSVESINKLKELCDHQIRLILELMSKRIKHKDYKIDKRYFYTLNDYITQSKTINYTNNKNELFSNDNFINDYIHMREEQTQVLFEMYSIIEDLNLIPSTAYIISTFLNEVSAGFNEKNNCQLLYDKLNNISLQLKKEKLPETRKEFENRAKLYVFLIYLDKFLNIKIEFSKKYKL